MAPMTAEVQDAPERSRYEITVDGKLAGFADYERHHRSIAFTHTEIDPRFEGHGLASQLIGSALDDVRASALPVLPFCPFVRAFIERHPDYVELVPKARRAAFGLAQ
jgi:predicted GNAT family acetyltransferase